MGDEVEGWFKMVLEVILPRTVLVRDGRRRLLSSAILAAASAMQRAADSVNASADKPNVSTAANSRASSAPGSSVGQADMSGRMTKCGSGVDSGAAAARSVIERVSGGVCDRSGRGEMAAMDEGFLLRLTREEDDRFEIVADSGSRG